MEAHYTTTSVLAVIVGNCLASFKSLFMLLLGINGNSFSRSLQQRVLSTIWLACLAWILQGLPFLPIVGIWLEGWDSMAGANRWSILVVLQWSILRALKAFWLGDLSCQLDKSLETKYLLSGCSTFFAVKKHLSIFAKRVEIYYKFLCCEKVSVDFWRGGKNLPSVFIMN